MDAVASPPPAPTRSFMDSNYRPFTLPPPLRPSAAKAERNQQKESERMANNDKSAAAVRPFVGEIRNGLKPSMRITIIGIVHSQPKSFVVSLINNSSDPDTDIGLHLTVSFQDRSVIRNAKVSGEWGKEERILPYFPFTPSQDFKMEILCEHQQFRVQVDGQQVFDFTHRIKQLQKLTSLKIVGDVCLTKVV
eukprot:gi/632942178/ref/XP_007886271.1/ PREDICTED: galectin-related protein A-like [Callorhinchus milii]